MRNKLGNRSRQPTADNNTNVIGLLIKKKKKGEYLIEGLNGVMAFTAND